MTIIVLTLKKLYIHLDTSALNCLFTNDEIEKCNSKLQNGKSGGAGEILNLHKSTIDLMMPVYLF